MRSSFCIFTNSGFIGHPVIWCYWVTNSFVK
jgi:hypothetical protein